MKEIYHDIFIGNEQDYHLIQRESNWAVLHCCKHPFHCQFVGYRGTLPSTHPNYALKRIENEMALNLVDMDRFSNNWLTIYCSLGGIRICRFRYLCSKIKGNIPCIHAEKKHIFDC